jgi:S-adenosylmethionine hydrolase
MSIVTLTTDLGTKDYYIGAIKGSLLSLNSDLQIIDITHEIPKFDIAVTAYTLKNCFTDFPKGTIHIIGVNTEFKSNSRHLVAKKDGYYFICSDNGFFDLLFKNQLDEVFEISLDSYNIPIKFATKEVFANIASEIDKGIGLENFGFPAFDLKESSLFKATNEGNTIKGMVIYIDDFGNVITNISSKIFNQVRNARSFEIALRKSKYNSESLNSIEQTYSDAPDGDVVAFFGHNDLLQIAINTGAANKLLGLKLKDVIRIDFNEDDLF